MTLKDLSHVRYCKKTGNLYWIKNKGNSNFDAKISTRPHKSGHLKICINGKYYLAHRIVWFMHYGKWPKILDHINRNGSDNRIENLREVTMAQNSMNTNKKPGKTGYFGVSKFGNIYSARVRYKGNLIQIARSKNPIEAAKAYDKWIIDNNMTDFLGHRLNFPELVKTTPNQRGIKDE